MIADTQPTRQDIPPHVPAPLLPADPQRDQAPAVLAVPRPASTAGPIAHRHSALSWRPD
jgi:hypothetical protein